MQNSFSAPRVSRPTITGKVAGGHVIGTMQRIPIASNNSCLFSSINFLLHNNSSDIQTLRELAASTIEADADTFNDITLDRPRAQYLQWIRRDDSWGGYIELIALSRAYNIQVIVIDILSGRKDEYGDVSSGHRIFLTYDGLHYDALAAEDRCCKSCNPQFEQSGDSGAHASSLNTLITIFDTQDASSLEKVRLVACNPGMLRRALFFSIHRPQPSALKSVGCENLRPHNSIR